MLEVISREDCALKGALTRIQLLPNPRTSMGSSEKSGLFCYPDAYGDDPYVDCPYDDYSDNVPDPDD